ncbi:DUF2975 domain-containing protein [Gephyromycinifex aptenodytis]|uniref:DUF2975 domain-containing protein n=1 Tax=Gephyromycinifex aptenodytis TaxID=2716227 RepID=UPI0014473419|nr:DUF2975 domain-containing protein [Gephyromycinifex aptenodytis]
MTTRFTLVTLRVLLLLGLAIAMAVQVIVLPVLSGWMAESYPEVAYMRWPVLTLTVLGLLFGEVVLVATWRLLDAIASSQIFASTSFAWVDGIIWSLAAATAVSVALFGYLTWVGIGPITVPVLALLTVLAALGMLLLMIVMRSLLQQASALHTDMEAVI